MTIWLAASPKTWRKAWISAEALPPLHVTIHSDYALDYRAWYLRGFKGYAQDAP